MSEMKQKVRFTVVQVTTIGVFSALVFAMNYLQIPLALAVGTSRIHLGNIMCLMAGFVLGPVGGGLAAGIGSELYDLMMGDLLYIPFYFVFKFLLAYCGSLTAAAMRKQAKPLLCYVTGAAVGQLVYIVLHLTCSTLTFDLFLYKLVPEQVVLNLIKRAVFSLINAGLAIVFSSVFSRALVPVYQAIRGERNKEEKA